MTFIDLEIFFDCPIHGLENQVFCFRSMDDNLKDRWVKYEVIHQRVEITDEEIKESRGMIAGISDSFLGG